MIKTHLVAPLILVLLLIAQPAFAQPKQGFLWVQFKITRPAKVVKNRYFCIKNSIIIIKKIKKMTKEEYLALAAEKYDSLAKLKSQDDFYEYEKSFEDIWIDLGRQVLEKNISEVPANHQKKTKFGRVSER